MALPFFSTCMTHPAGRWAMDAGVAVWPAIRGCAAWWRRLSWPAVQAPMQSLGMAEPMASALHHDESLADSASGAPSGPPGPTARSRPDMPSAQLLADALPHLVCILPSEATHTPQTSGGSSEGQTYLNQRWEDFTGVARDAIVQNWRGVIHPDDMRQLLASWTRALRSGEPTESEFRVRRADGHYCWMLGRAVALPLEGGRPGQWLVTCTDVDHLKTAAAQLEKSMAIKRLAGRVARLGGWSIELPDHVLTWSDENCLIHDAPPGYQPTLDEGISFFLPEHQAQVRQYVQACATHGTPYDFVLPKYTLKHRLIWVRSIGEAVRDASGQIIRVQGAFQDVTAQKEAEARTRALEVQLSATMESITDGFYLLDANWNFIYLNATAERMFRQPRAALLGKSVWSVFPDKLGTLTEAEFHQTVQAQRTRHFEVYYPPLGAWFDVHSYPMGVGIAVYLHDITQRRAEQSQLRLLQTAVARLNDTLVIAEALSPSEPLGHTPVVFVNDAFERCTGFGADLLLGQDFAGTLRSHLGPDGWTRVSHAMTQSKPVRTELTMTSQSGAEIWLEVDVTPIMGDSGQVSHWVAVKRDITGRRRDQQEILSLSHSLNRELESRVQLRTDQLARANHALESFAYAVSHDLRSPLNTIAGFTQLLLKSDGTHVSPKGHHYLARISAGAHQLGDLIGGLLTLAHLSRDEPQLQTVDVSAMAERLVLHGQRQQPDRQAVLRVQPGMRAQADPRLLEVVLHHLLDNAWKFSARRSVTHIDVGSEVGADGVCVFFVKDNGAGFDMAFKHKLFGTFERLHSPGEFTGTGIGLATAQRVVESHGGRIWADSRVDQGATFYFTLDKPARRLLAAA